MSLSGPLERWNFAWVNGEPVRLAQSFEIVNPATGEQVGRAPKGGKKLTLQAIDAASEAFQTWGRTLPEERARVLHGWADRLLQHQAELALLMSLEQGKPLEEAEGEIEGSARFIRWYAEEAKRIYGETLPGSRAQQRIMVWRQPVGVVGMITPWNFPAAMVARKVAPALAAGCTVVLKPAKQTPLIAIAMFAQLIASGLPPGVANLVTGDAAAIGDTLLGDRRVRKISFTGSTEVGKRIMQKAADQVKRLSLELGGNAPVIVFADADLDLAAEAIVSNKFENCGQVCNGINVIYAQREIQAALCDKIAARVRSLKVGLGTEPGVQMGPLIDEPARAKVTQLVADAKAKGAQVITGGHCIEGAAYERGYFYAPTVLAGVTADMALTQEEIFGPVAPIASFDEEQEVLDRCNETPYGLAAYVFTRNLSRIYRMSEGLEFGMVAVNGTSLSVPQAPFGGIKESGMGREGGHHGLDEFLELKYVSLTLVE
ncbi:NAD-dependent succinate-semialdehyde dehydrogenase [Paenibacillus cremeus]|uniref:NAD-dependent succinate-semialdehyde dehydrogenase n=1 Tax=Paenibacillus cremeus TaxID=2163881 RepID=A0A559JZV1_9BACL|nr:NAD-dependent succinate-semialdehyde dehydrogenase [Paenibacillus cremeus]TVY05411.1 NAD-dependent succinate-semialdehyde dehydrogenase [Paenibacillus cremeus]